MSLLVGAVEADVDLDVVVVMVAFVVISPMMTTPCLLLLPIKVLLKEILGIPLRDVGTVHPVLLIVLAVVLIVVEVLAMVKLVKDAHEGHMIATVGLDEGNIDILFLISDFLQLIFLSLLISIVQFAVVDSNVKALDEAIGELNLMKLLSKHRINLFI